MFQRIDRLPLFDTQKRRMVQDRWDSDEGERLHAKILGMIREGAGEDFLQWDYQQGELGNFLEDEWDLQGIKILNEKIIFPDADNFEGIDFSYAWFSNSKLINACFLNTYFNFTELNRIEFRNCVFVHSVFYGAEVRHCKFISCDIIDYIDTFDNSELKDTLFQNCFFMENSFYDCKFDENVNINNSDKLPEKSRKGSSTLERKNVSGIYRGIKEGYLAGQVNRNAQEFHFLQQQAYTRYNLPRGWEKLRSYFWEGLTGYGLKPFRVIICLFTIAVVFYSYFSWRLDNWRESLVFTAGALLTFGAKADLLDKLCWYDHVMYIIASFAGISLIATFITVMANVHLKDT